MNKIFAPMIAGSFAIALAGCVVPGGGIVLPSSPYDQTIGLTTATGARETLTQTFSANAAAANVTRICLTNNTGGPRTLTHNFMPQINPLDLAPGGRNCANFPANNRVIFTALAAGRPVTPDRALSYSTTILAGGLLDLVWR